MNCQDHLYRNIPPQTLARRWFFQQCGVGLGAIALGQLVRRQRRAAAAADPLAAEAAALRAARRRTSSSCSWPAPRATWSCSTTSRSWRSSTARCRRPSCSRATAPRSSTRTRSCSGRSSSSPSTASAAPSSRSCCRTWRRSSTTSRSSSRWSTDAFNHAPGQILMNTGSQQFGRPSLGVVDALRPGQRVAEPARLRRLQHRQQRARAAATRTGAAASCRPSTKACSSARSGDPVLYLSNPRGVDRRAAARLARRDQRS